MKKILACLLALMMLTTPIKAYAFDWPWKKGNETETTEAVAEAETLSAAVVEEKEEAEVSDDAVEEAVEAEAEPEELPPLNYDYEELVVGTTMPTYGTFFTTMWGNGSSDIAVRNLIHGYNLVEWDSETSGFIFDPSVVSGTVVRETAAGDHTYTIILYNDLFWSDGSRITARDYAFSLLLRMDPEIEKLGGTPEDLKQIAGYQNYVTARKAYVAELERNNGNLNAVTRQPPRLSGLRVINDTQLTVTISHNMLPFFYELALLDCAPSPISVIAPGCSVQDSATGAYIQGNFTAKLLESTLMGKDGYLAKPSLTCGPYKLVSCEGQEAKFELNEHYKGDSHGAKPTIERIVFKQANAETMIDELMAGDFGLITRTTGAEQIQEGMRAIQKDPRYAAANYPRTGLGFIAFNRENPAFESKEVRQAIAHCVDKDAMTGEAVSNFGLRADGYYGLGQWMYQLLNGTVAYPVEEPGTGATTAEKSAYERELAEWEALTKKMEELPVYNRDLQEAVRLLEKDGWTLNRQGDPFDPEKDDVRCKRIDGELVALELKLIYAKGVAIEEELKNLAEPMAEVGIVLKTETSDKLLELYYGHEERDYDMIFLATDFNVLFDPSPSFEPEGAFNYYGTEDEELYDLAEDMIRTEPGDLLDYCGKWLDFQEYFIEQEPIIPIYSNIYFDFYPRVLREYAIADYSSWAQAVVPAYLSDIPEEDMIEAEEEDVFKD